MTEKEIMVNDGMIRLDSLLKFAGLFSTGGAAKVSILAGEVRLNGEVCTIRGKKIYAGDTVQWGDTLLHIRDK